MDILSYISTLFQCFSFSYMFSKYIKLTCLVILLFAFKISSSQTNFSIPDSLLEKSDRDKIYYLSTYAQDKTTLEEAEFWNRSAIRVALEYGSDSLLAECYGVMAYNYKRFEAYREAIYAADTASVYCKKSKHQFWHIQSTTLKGEAFKWLNEIDSAFIYLKKALELSQQYGDSLRMADTFNNLGHFYKLAYEDNLQTKNYYLKALSMYNALNSSPKEKLTVYNNLSLVSENIEESDQYAKKAEEIALKSNNPTELLFFYLDMANTYSDQQRNEKGFEAIKKCEKVAKENHITIYDRYIKMLKGMLLLNIGAYDESIDIFEFLKSNYDFTANKEALQTNLLTAYQKAHRYKEAFEIAEVLINEKDSLLELKDKQQLAEFDSKFRAAEKDRKISEQKLKIAEVENEKNQWIIIGLLIFASIVILSQYLINQFKRKKVKAENALSKSKEIDVVRTELLGNISHEIRTPLTLVHGNIELALEDGDLSDKSKAFLNIALQNAKTVVEDANQILDLLKIEQKVLKLNKTITDIESFCKRIVFSFEPVAHAKQIKLLYNAYIKDKHVLVDAYKIEKILNNLLANALKYSDSDTSIHVVLKQEENKFCIEVTDQGWGIDTEDQRYIFKRFYQGKDSKKVGGVGIGLALSKEFAILHGGDLYFVSEIGQGTTFTLEFPLERVQKAFNVSIECNDELGEVEDDKKEKKEKILIVEDHIEMSNYLKSILEKDYDCTVAFNGQEALDILQSQSFDLITSDIMMPKLDGFEFRQKIKEVYPNNDLPFIFVSAKSLEEDKLRGLELGVDDYIIKPFNKNELFARVKNLINNRVERLKTINENKEILEEVEINNSYQDDFMNKVKKIIEKNMDNEDFKVTDLSSEMGYSQRQLNRLIKEYTGLTPVKYILEVRMQKAYILLKQKMYPTVSEVQYEIGISSSTHFNKKFKERFGISPGKV